MIETNHLYLLPCELKHFEAFLQSRQTLAKLLNIRIPDSWPHFPEAITYTYQLLKEKANPTSPSNDWNMYLFIHRNEASLIGSGGFKGAPDANGRVEIGYEIVPDYRGQGLATEAAQGLTSWAFSDKRVSIVQAHTLAEINASTRVLQKIGMIKIKTIDDEENGSVWLWQTENPHPN